MKIERSGAAVSPVVGIVFLIAIVVVLSALVFTVTSGFVTEQQAPSAGANVTIASESVIEVQLDSVQNADHVYVQSPLGTRYELEEIGDTVDILNIGNEQKPVVIAEKDGKEHVVQGITPRSFNADYIVAKDGSGDFGTVHEAVTAAGSNGTSGETIVIKRNTYSESPDIDEDVKIVSEHGTKIDGTITISKPATFSNTIVENGSIDVGSEGVYLASNESTVNKNEYNVIIDNAGQNLLRQTEDNSTGDNQTSNSKPVADFTNTPSSPTKNESISFDASSSSDPDGSIKSYSWDFNGDGKEDASGPSATYSYDTVGTHPVSLTIEDGENATDTVTKDIGVIKEMNTSLVSLYGMDGDVKDSIGGYDGVDETSEGYTSGAVGPKAKMFDGDTDKVSVSEYPSIANDGHLTIATWVNIDTLQNDGNGHPYVIFNANDGSDKIQIENKSGNIRGWVRVNASSQGSVTHTASTGSWYHVAMVVTPNQYNLYVDGEKVSTNSYSNSLSHFGTGQLTMGSNNSQTRNFDGSIDDVHVYNDSLTQSEVLSLYEKGDVFPTASFDYSPKEPTVGDSVSFDGSNSSDPDGSISSYEWDFNSDGNVDKTGTTVSKSFENTGSQEVSLTVTDTDGRTNSTSSVIELNGSPTPEFVYSPTDPESGESITFDASNSSDSDGTIESYEWDFDGDGQIDATGETVTHSYSESNTYTVSLTVKDDVGASATSSQDVSVGSTITNGLIAQFDFESGGGSTALDSSGNNYDGSIDGAEWTNSSASGQYALNFNDNSDLVDFGDVDNVEGLNSGTWSVWINASHNNGYQMISVKEPHYYDGGEPWEMFIWREGLSGRGINFSYKDTNNDSHEINLGERMLENQWVLYTVTWDSSKLKIYENGQLKNTSNATGTMKTTNDPMVLGHTRNPSSQWEPGMKGLADDFRIYNRALSQDEIQQIYNSSS